MNHITVFEALWFILLAVCTYQILKKQNAYRLLNLYLIIPYTFILEYTAMSLGNAYTYGNFLITIGGAPVSICAGWAVIIYAFMELSETIKTGIAVKSFITALMALALDLVMDPICIWLGYWKYNVPGIWFNVPWQNLVGWVTVVFIYSYLTRYVNTLKNVEGFFKPLLVFLLSLICLGVYTALMLVLMGVLV